VSRHAALRARAVAAIPDVPVTVETRALARDPTTMVHAIGASWLLIAARGDLARVFGDADALAVDAILDVAGFDGALLLPDNEATTWSARWKAERALIYTVEPRASGAAATPETAFDVGRLTPGHRLEHVPDELRGEVERARASREVFAAFCDGVPVSFAYMSLETERHGDLSIDTLAAFRRRGYGAAALHPVNIGLGVRGLSPVWGAIEHNAASLALARKLGFTRPAGTLLVATRRT
jgi:hypothetical protein